MSGQQPYAEGSSASHRSGDGVGNVMVLEVEKDLGASRLHFSNDGRTGGGKQLGPDFIETTRFA
jgi:hypothetical protein